MFLQDYENAIEADDFDNFIIGWQFHKDESLYEEYNALQFAIYNLSVKIVKFLLEDGYYHINEHALSDGQTPLLLAMNEFNADAAKIVGMIFKYYPSVDMNIINHDNFNVVMCGVNSGISEKYIIKCAEKISDLELINANGENVLGMCLNNIARFRAHSELIKLYIDRGAIVNSQDMTNILSCVGTSGIPNIVLTALQDRNDLSDLLLEIATKYNHDFALPDDVKEMFLF